ncbi:MAG: hypothetical protein J6Y20_05625 [Lachnospiraceae bacterium]|nr:hypothetical protein [Lachnospiraceae bacterium]
MNDYDILYWVLFREKNSERYTFVEEFGSRQEAECRMSQLRKNDPELLYSVLEIK